MTGRRTEEKAAELDRQRIGKIPDHCLSGSEAAFSGRRLLLVEDNIVNMEIARLLLTQAGFAVETAENGQAAVDMVSASEAGYYHAVLMDIQMPVMDGYEATRTIRALDRRELAEIPIVALTSNAFREDVEAARAFCALGHKTRLIGLRRAFGAIKRL